MTTQQAQELANNLTTLTKQFKSQDALQAAEVKRAFKEKSKNDLIRTVAYLLEVVGVRDYEFRNLQEENKDLKELLKVHDIDLEAIANENGPIAEKDGETAAGDGALSSVGGTEASSGTEATTGS